MSPAGSRSPPTLVSLLTLGVAAGLLAQCAGTAAHGRERHRDDPETRCAEGRGFNLRAVGDAQPERGARRL